VLNVWCITNAMWVKKVFSLVVYVEMVFEFFLRWVTCT